MSTNTRHTRSPAMHVLAAFVLGLVTLIGGDAAADTAYTANEATATVSVIDTTTHKITTTIGLGSAPAIPGTPQPDGPFNGEKHHSAFYNGHVDPHGLWLTPDGKVLLVANRISGTLVAVDTATNKVLGYAPTGREPHLATVRPGGKEAWLAVRGESYIHVIEINYAKLYDKSLRPTARMPSIAAIDTVKGPSMVSFTSDGKFAFVAAGKEARVEKIDADSRKIVTSRAVPAKFSPFGLVTPNDEELYLVHKGAGKLSILRTSDLSAVVQGMPIGPRANHVWFAGGLAYITIGGPKPSADSSDPEGKVVVIDRKTHKIVREFKGPMFTGDPHAIWGTSDGRLYIGHERGSRVTVINLGEPNDPADDEVETTVTGSESDLAFLKKPIDIVIKP